MSMGLSMSMGMYLDQRPVQGLSLDQKLVLKKLLGMRQHLKEPSFPNAAKGLEGMLTAHAMLKDRNSYGVLIGGLAEEVWSQKRKEEDLYKHKDVDVMVINSDFSLSEDFEGGVDWWLPYTERMTTGNVFSRVEADRSSWSNGCNVTLNFGIKQKFMDEYSQNPELIEEHYGLNPGLYILRPEEIVNLRLCEALSNIDYRVNVEIDDEVIEAFEENVGKTMKTRIPKFIREPFEGYILSNPYERKSGRIYPIGFEGIDFEVLVAINRRVKNEREHKLALD